VHQPETACCFLKFGRLQRRHRRRLKTKRIRMTFVKRCCCSLTCAGGMHTLNDFERWRCDRGTGRRNGSTARTGPENEARRIARTDRLAQWGAVAGGATGAQGLQ